MNWLEKIRSQPVEKRLRLLWTIIAIAAVLLIFFWILIGNYGSKAKPDTSLFKSMKTDFIDFSHQDFKSTNTSTTNLNNNK